MLLVNDLIFELLWALFLLCHTLVVFKVNLLSLAQVMLFIPL